MYEVSTLAFPRDVVNVDSQSSVLIVSIWGRHTHGVFRGEQLRSGRDSGMSLIVKQEGVHREIKRKAARISRCRVCDVLGGWFHEALGEVCKL